jgi:hypothetical protein
VKLNLRQSGSWIGMGGLAVMLFPYAFSGLLAPVWAVVVLLLLWAVLFGLGCKWFMHKPYHVLALPLVAAVIWFGGINLGGWLLGWTA